MPVYSGNEESHPEIEAASLLRLNLNGLEVHRVLSKTKRRVAELRKGELLDRPDPGRAETEVPADLLVSAGETVFEPNPHRQDVGLTLGEAIDRVPE